MRGLAQPGIDSATIRRLLTAKVMWPRFGAELISPDLTQVEDISHEVTGGSITHNITGPVHGSCDLAITRELAWGRDRVRIYATLTDGEVTARWNLGVYLLTTPARPHGEDPPTFQVKGYDAISHLQRLIGDSKSIAAGTNAKAAIEQLVSDSGVGAPVRVDSDAASEVLPSTITWPSMAVGGVQPTWIRAITDLTGAIGYRPLWADGDGMLRTGLYRPDKDRPSEWTFTPADWVEGVVEPVYTTTADVWGQPNRWFFYMNRAPSALIEGITLYVKNNLDVGRSSQLSIGLNPAPPQGLDAMDYPTLVTLGDQIAHKQIYATETIDADLGTFPALWHEDIATWADAQGRRKVKCVRWTMPLDAGPVKTTWEVIV